MFNLPEQFNEFNTNNIEAALRFSKIFLDNTERLVKLQLDAAKQAVEDGAKNAKALSSVKDPQEALALRAKLAEAGIESALGYSRSVYEASSQAQSEIAQLFEERIAFANKGIAAAMDKAVKSAPAGTDVAFAAVKSTVAATTAAMDSMTKAAKQVADFADASVRAAGTATADAVKTAAKKSSAA